MKYIVKGELEDEGAFYGQYSEVYVNINLKDIEPEIESYAKDYLDMGREEDFEDNPWNCQDDELIEVLENRGHSFLKNIIFDRKLSIVEASTINTLLTNIDKIPLKELNNLVKKYNLYNEGRENLIGYE